MIKGDNMDTHEVTTVIDKFLSSGEIPTTWRPVDTNDYVRDRERRLAWFAMDEPERRKIIETWVVQLVQEDQNEDPRVTKLVDQYMSFGEIPPTWRREDVDDPVRNKQRHLAWSELNKLERRQVVKKFVVDFVPVPPIPDAGENAWATRRNGSGITTCRTGGRLMGAAFNSCRRR